MNETASYQIILANLPLVVVIIILFIDTRDGNESTNSCGNNPVVDQNVWDFLHVIYGTSTAVVTDV